ncbi:hypothetical protein [Subtercola sp. RTI3]|uniref:hypothetical protein n=1 Tax=Subtercola sp. RTI3 TaxID=3048639 RepID=UPI002B2314B0|nr:hypothetical protein [Subtercola sp. RTI3]MEA9983649.1 hypothetical protein [Subtercola sp. RTI3]
MSRTHTAWLKAQVETIPALASKTFVGIIPEQMKVAPPYVVIHPSSGTNTATRASSGRFTKNPRWIIHSVGVTADQAALIGEKVGEVLVPGGVGVGVTPVISGELPDPIWWNSPAAIQVDKELVPWVIFHVAECGFSSYPA